MTTLPVMAVRGNCPICGTSFRVTPAGHVPRHRATNPEHQFVGSYECRGVGKVAEFS